MNSFKSIIKGFLETSLSALVGETSWKAFLRKIRCFNCNINFNITEIILFIDLKQSWDLIETSVKALTMRDIGRNKREI